jgi:transcription elongation factor GreA
VAADQSPSLTDALGQYVLRLKGTEQRDGQQELNRFIQWCGRDRSVGELTPPEVAEYGESANIWGADSAKKLKPVKSFLTYLKERKLVSVSLAPHLKVSKTKREHRRAYFTAAVEQAELSHEGYTNLQSRLEMLKEERVLIVGDIQRAMGDKDFRENAPLDAAKERQGLIESSIKELEGILANAVVTVTQADADVQKVRIGRKVTLRDASSGKEVRYTLVDSREANPVSGKISSISPVGKALLDRVIGEEVTITVPKGTLHYVIENIES